MCKKSVFQKLVEESVVLLKNEDHVLPLKKNQKAAFFGRAQIETFFSGNGSGASTALASKNILSECEKRGICAEPVLKDFYEEHRPKKQEKFAVDGVDITRTEGLTSGFMYEIFGRYQPVWKEHIIPEKVMISARKYTDTAILVLGRNSGGEECDRHVEEDYYLTESEKDFIEQVTSSFSKVILILNINGLMDLSWISDCPEIKAVLFAGIPGEDGCGAIADILTVNVNPSGKLSVSVAENYHDYPSAEHFTWNKENPDGVLTYESYGLSAEENGSLGYTKSPVTIYQEDIYAGYRYFESFHKKVLFPFGFGLSYTKFEISGREMNIKEDEIELIISIKNTGSCAGKETVQVYLSCENTASERPLKELKSFEKTELLAPGMTEEIHISVSKKEMACYVEEKAAYVLEKGIYRLLAGNSSDNVSCVYKFEIREDTIVQNCANRLQIQKCNVDKLQFLSVREGSRTAKYYDMMTEKQDCTVNGASEAEIPKKIMDKVSTLDIEELASLCVGYGPGIPFAAFSDEEFPETIFDKDGKPLTVNDHPLGANGYVSPAIPDKGIHSVFYKDGPAGVGTGAWPTEMLISCAFNKKLWYEFGNLVGQECEKQKVDVWLAPAVNLHRHPLCGRNFEYFSEDPYLTGICAVEIARGVQENHPVRVCPKHFAVNEQETFRRGSAKKNYDAADSILTERAARELYLKPFEMLVRDAGISFLMTSFNKINGTFAGGNRDLCTHILRDEWGFEGVAVTDWGDMDMVVDGGDAVAAGNDIVMPGGPPVIRQILKAYEEGRIGRCDLERSVGRLLKAGYRFYSERGLSVNETYKKES